MRLLIKLLTYVVTNIFYFFFKNNIREKNSIIQLKNEITNINTSDSSKNSDVENKWEKRNQNLSRLILHDNPRYFLKWDVIRSTMFAAFYREEFLYLKNNSNWKKKWRKAIRESFIGFPERCVEYPISSGNLIHHAYHLAKFEEYSKIDLSEDIDLIFEFGGGYGSMCRLFHDLGFKGKYIMFDLPLFSAIQRYYLSSIEILDNNNEPKINNIDINIYSKKLILKKELLKIDPKKSNTLFIGTWSLSEVPLGLREDIIKMLAPFSNILIAYQDYYGEFDNINYFKSIQHKLNTNTIWTNFEIKHLPNNYYLFGKKSNVSIKV